jgi:hypothetical protein
MRFILIHKTNQRWEAGAVPSRELIARVGRLLGDMAKAKALPSGEGLRASSLGARIRRSAGTLTVHEGPFGGKHELPAGFDILRAESLDEAVAWASRQAEILGRAQPEDVEIDVRPVTEPWDIGIAPPPEPLPQRRYMALRKATAASEAGTPLSLEARAALEGLRAEAAHGGAQVVAVTLAPSRRGRRYQNSADGIRVTDGPFTESKELVAGYVLLTADSLADAERWALRYLETVEADEVDLREVETSPA